MAYSLRAISIFVALGVSTVFVLVAFFISGPGSLREVSAEDTEELLKAYAAKDTDADGLPDWQEALYGTDPDDASSVQDGMNDGAAVAAGLVKPKFESEEIPEAVDSSTLPGSPPAPLSLTEKFSRVFLESYMNASGGQPMAAADQQALVSFLLRDFSAKASEDLKSSYTLSSVRQSTSVSTDTYVASVEQVMLAYQSPDNAASPLALAQDYIEVGDESAKAKLDALARMYANKANALASVVAPVRFSAQHLQLLRSYDTLAKATNAVASYKEDPLLVLGALSLYQPAASEFMGALRVLSSAIMSEGEPVAGEPGAVILSIVRSSPTP